MAHIKALPIIINWIIGTTFGINILRLIEGARQFVNDNNAIISFVSTWTYQIAVLILVILKVIHVTIQIKKEASTIEPSKRKSFWKTFFNG